mmetsp:Transcript_29976/g.52613  ORF Transcript_29976/g.52613 Transcript_29976/m.52613 type:complete len:296 (-) Transcript_29976:122-1009(-)|eukprot:CAMPEP_0197528090 /NCGR_PEP_ID=MMETSP1318-20131121/23822_1 /TAXON_ID=552666 /ORGANISM="Partenskyella glossopodia, Strain RCC365" /LENGTH=295 /DNA_ID=CAMNT_0043083019 /DNA_START=73 /DNA_END=960 /DNA_ORIENTATION=+
MNKVLHGTALCAIFAAARSVVGATSRKAAVAASRKMATATHRNVQAGFKAGSSSDVLTVMVSLKVKENEIKKFIDASIMDAQGSVTTEEGCRRFDVIRDATEPNRFAYCEIYDSKEAFEHHLTTPHFAKWKEIVPDLLEEKETVTFCKNVYPCAEGSRFESIRPDTKPAVDPYFEKGSLHVISCPFYIKPECVDGFLEAIVEDAVSSCAEEPGCLRFDVFQSIDNPGTIYLYEVYANLDAFTYHCGTPHIAKWIEATKDMQVEQVDGVKVGDLQDSVKRLGPNVWPPDNYGWASY